MSSATRQLKLGRTQISNINKKVHDKTFTHLCQIKEFILKATFYYSSKEEANTLVLMIMTIMIVKNENAGPDKMLVPLHLEKT